MRNRIAGRRWGSWSIAGTRTPIGSSSIRSWGQAATSWSPNLGQTLSGGSRRRNSVWSRLARNNRLFFAFLARLLVGAVGVVQELERQLQQPFRDSTIAVGWFGDVGIFERSVFRDEAIRRHDRLRHGAVTSRASDVREQLPHELAGVARVADVAHRRHERSVDDARKKRQFVS